MASGLSLVLGGGNARGLDDPGEPLRAGHETPRDSLGEPWRLPNGASAFQETATLSEIFANSSRDAGWAEFLLGQVDRQRPLLWVQDRMAIIESGRVHPPGLDLGELIHVEARDSKSALWAMEEGLRCAAIGVVIGEIWGDPAALDFTATRRLAVAAERHGVAAYLVRLSGTANLSGARFRWRVASAPSLPHPLNPRAPGAATWQAELFRARGSMPGAWRLTNEANGLHLVAEPVDRTLDEVGFKQAG